MKMVSNDLKISILVLLTAFLCSCGFFSNDVYFVGFGSVSGRILVDKEPVSDALVFIKDEPENLATTDDGVFSLSETKAGKELFLVIMWGSSMGLKHRFDLAGGVYKNLGEMELAPVGYLEGTVNSPDPLQVEVRVVGTPFVTSPDQEGDYRLMLPAGDWSLEISAPGYLTEIVDDIGVASGQNHSAGDASLRPDPGYVCDSVESRTDRFSQGGGGSIDILFVIDNSYSMVGEQKALAYSFSKFVTSLKNGGLDYRIAVLTTGMESEGCPRCGGVITGSCMNETGENGRFQDRRGKNNGTEDLPDFDFITDSGCRVVDHERRSCFFDQEEDRGTVLVGVNGCGYERGLAAMRRALESDLLSTHNSRFLREEARLAIIVVSDENDCGEVGDVSENIPGVSGSICFYAAKGVGPEDETVHPDDPDRRPYALTPVYEYASFLCGLKQFPSMVSFSAIVGISDQEDPASTTIEYRWDTDKQFWGVAPACSTEGCTGEWCDAKPGTRYIELAGLTGGSVESICQLDFSTPMLRVVGASTGYRRSFSLDRTPLFPNDLEVQVNGESEPTGWRWSPAENAVVFEEGAEPLPYSLIEVKYDTACD